MPERRVCPSVLVNKCENNQHKAWQQMTIAPLCDVSPAFHCSPVSPVFPVYLVSLVSCVSLVSRVSLVLCSLLSILSPLSSVLHYLSCLSDCRSFTSCVLVYFVYFVSFMFLESLVSKVSFLCGSVGNCHALFIVYMFKPWNFFAWQLRVVFKKISVFNFCKCISDLVGPGQLQHVLLLLGQAGDTQGQLQSWRICVQVCAGLWAIVWEL